MDDGPDALRAAMIKYGDDLTIAATAAVGKKRRTDEVRVIFYGTNGVDLNPGLRVRDQVRYSTAADTKVAVEDMTDEWGGALFDRVRRAHGPPSGPGPPGALGPACLPGQRLRRARAAKEALQ